MDERGKKRLTAALAAVYRYLRSQEEQQLAMAAVSQSVSAPALGASGLWSASGRQAMMEMRKLLQMRVIR
jgi:stage V sporulation protein SpoVS